MITELCIKDWYAPLSATISNTALNALESGHVLFLPQLDFPLLDDHQKFLSEHYSDQKNKNISYDYSKGSLQGIVCATEERKQAKAMMQRYAVHAKTLLTNLLPLYNGHITQARTSFRPVEIAGRKAPSYRKDDTRLHVDAFPANPTQGKRILRVFTNVNPNAKPRVWRLGAPFNQVASSFLPRLTKPVAGSALIMKTLKMTKAKRTPYDHYMLQLHNKMKGDMAYQQQVEQQEFLFPANSTWIVFTDQVSHAALAGQYVFEQTFYVSPNGLAAPEKSPLGILEDMLGTQLLRG